MSADGAKRILHVVGSMNRGGAETMIMNAFRHIDRTRFMFDFAVSTDEPSAYDDEIRALGGRIFPHPKPGDGIGRWLRAFEGTLRDHGPFGAVHSHVHGFSGFTLGSAKRMGVPIRIAHSHNTQDGKNSTGLRQAYRWWTRRRMHATATQLIACSRAAGESLFGRSRNGADGFQVLPNAIDLAPYAALPQTRAERLQLRDRLGLPANGLLIGHVGRFSPPKNHTFLIDILAEVCAAQPDAHAILVGDGPLKPEIEAKVAALGLEGRILFLGIRSDIPQLMGAMDIFLLPSLHEGLPVVLVEAQAAGVPCLIADTITTETDQGIDLVDFMGLDSSPHEWATQIHSLDDCPRPLWTRRAAALQQTGYDISSSVPTLKALYEKA